MRGYIDAAKVIGRKNLDGRLAVKATAGLPFLLEEGMESWIVPPQIDVPRNVRIEGVWDEGSQSPVVSLSGIDDASMADSIIGCHLLVAEDDVDLSYAEHAVAAMSSGFDGWSFLDKESGISGTIVDAEEMPNQVLLTVELDGQDGTALVPLVDEFLVDADEAGRKIILSLPKGIFEL